MLTVKSTVKACNLKSHLTNLISVGSCTSWHCTKQ